MVQTFNGPDGTPYDFPDEMSMDDIKGVFRRKFPQTQPSSPAASPATTSPGPAPNSSAPPQPGPNVVPSPNAAPIPPPAPPSPDTNQNSFTSGLLNHLHSLGKWAAGANAGAFDTATFGWGDKALAATDPRGSYADNLTKARAQTAAGYRDAPIASAIGGMAPLAMAGGPSLAGAITRPGITGALARFGASGLEGAGQGALTAAGHDEDVGTGAAIGGVLGAGLSPVASAIGGIAKNVGQRFDTKVPIPTTDDLLYAKNTALDNLQNFFYGTKDLSVATKAARNDAANLGLDEKLHPVSTKLYNDWQDFVSSGNKMKRADLVEEWQDRIRDALQKPNVTSKDQEIGQKLSQRIGDVQQGANPISADPALNGNVQASVQALDAVRQATQKHTASTYLDQLQRQREIGVGGGQKQPAAQAGEWLNDPSVLNKIAPLPEQQKSLMQIANPSGGRQALESFAHIPYWVAHPALSAVELGAHMMGAPIGATAMSTVVHPAFIAAKQFAGNKAAQGLVNDLENARRSLVGATNPSPTGISQILQDPQLSQRIRSLMLRGAVNETTPGQ